MPAVDQTDLWVLTLGLVDKKNSQDGLNMIRTCVLKLTKSTLNVRWKRHAPQKDTLSEHRRAAVLRQTGNTSMHGRPSWHEACCGTNSARFMNASYWPHARRTNENPRASLVLSTSHLSAYGSAICHHNLILLSDNCSSIKRTIDA